MPLFLLYLSNIGDILAKSFKWLYSRVCKCQRAKKVNQEPVGVLKKTGTFSVKSLNQEANDASNSSGASVANNPCAVGAAGDLISVYSEYLEGPQPVPKAILSTSLDNVTVPISLCLAVMVSYICGGALLFGQWEGWGFLDGSYFCFITLSTIGFGDIVPGAALTPDDQIDSRTDQGIKGVINTKFVLCSMYILIGMAVIAMCFSLMQEKVVQGVRSMGRKIGIIKD